MCIKRHVLIGSLASATRQGESDPGPRVHYWASATASERNRGTDRKFDWFTADGGRWRIRCLKLIQLNMWRWSSLNGLRRKGRELLLWPTPGAQSTTIIRAQSFILSFSVLSSGSCHLEGEINLFWLFLLHNRLDNLHNYNKFLEYIVVISKY